MIPRNVIAGVLAASAAVALSAILTLDPFVQPVTAFVLLLGLGLGGLSWLSLRPSGSARLVTGVIAVTAVIAGTLMIALVVADLNRTLS